MNGFNNLYKLNQIFSFEEKNLLSKSIDSNEIEHYEFERLGIKYFLFLSKYRFEYNDEFYSENKPIEYITFNNDKKKFNILQIPTQKDDIKETKTNDIKEKIKQIIENEKTLLNKQKIEIHRIKNPDSVKDFYNIYLNSKYSFLKKVSRGANNKLIETDPNNPKIKEQKIKMIEEFNSTVSIEHIINLYNYRKFKIKPTLEKTEIISIKEINECIIMEVEALININNNLRKRILYFIKSIDSPKFNNFRNINLTNLFNDTKIVSDAQKNNALTKDYLKKFEMEFNSHLEQTLNSRIHSTLNEIHNLINDEKQKHKENRELRLKEEEKSNKTLDILDYLKDIRKD